MNKSVGDVEKILEKRATLINKELSLISYALEPPELAEMLRYALSQKGKRVRASLLTLACEAVGGKLTQALIPAVTVEMIHNTSLILDDVIDASEIRRGTATINSKWGNNMAMIACDAMLALTIKHAAKSDANVTRAIIECASGSLIALAEGEAMELVNRNYNINDYFKIAQRKTASLFSVATEVGAIVGGGSKKEINALKRYGDSLGIAFQIKDDVLDFTANREVFGKPTMVDLRMDRPTLVLLLAEQNGLSRENMLSMGRDDLLKALEPSINIAESIAIKKVDEARSELSIIKESEAKDYLLGVCDYVLARPK